MFAVLEKYKDTKVVGPIVRKILGFSVVGALMTLLSMFLTWVCNDLLHMNIYVAYVAVYGLTILISCVMNARLVWNHKLELADVFKYFAIYLSSMVLGMIVIYLFGLVFTTLNHTLLSYCALPFTYVWNYLFVNHIFKKKDGE